MIFKTTKNIVKFNSIKKELKNINFLNVQPTKLKLTFINEIMMMQSKFRSTYIYQSVFHNRLK